MRKHFLIVGGGIAGLCIAKELLHQDGEVTLIDSGLNASSRVAAGQINPIVFRRMTKSWRVDDFLPFAISFYNEIQSRSSLPIKINLPIRRLFAHEQEKQLWLEKQSLPEFSDYLTPLEESDLAFEAAQNICGSGRVKQSFYVSSENFLLEFLRILNEDNRFSYSQTIFDYTSLDPEKVTYENTSYDEVIFCEGYQSKNNPWFKDLPIDPTKGQLLTIESDTIYNEESLNRKCFVLPANGNQYKVGSTYEWHNNTLNITEEAREEIEVNLKSLINDPYTVVNQTAGIRPTTRDRRPMAGKHPEHPKLSIFNGLGAKGYLIGPLLAKEFVNHLLTNAELDKEIDIQRFYK